PVAGGYGLAWGQARKTPGDEGGARGEQHGGPGTGRGESGHCCFLRRRVRCPPPGTADVLIRRGHPCGLGLAEYFLQRTASRGSAGPDTVGPGAESNGEKTTPEYQVTRNYLARLGICHAAPGAYRLVIDGFRCRRI